MPATLAAGSAGSLPANETAAGMLADVKPTTTIATTILYQDLICRPRAETMATNFAPTGANMDHP